MQNSFVDLLQHREEHIQKEVCTRNGTNRGIQSTISKFKPNQHREPVGNIIPYHLLATLARNAGLKH